MDGINYPDVMAKQAMIGSAQISAYETPTVKENIERQISLHQKRD